MRKEVGFTSPRYNCRVLLIDVLGPVVAIVAIGALIGPRIGLQVATLSRIAYWILGPAFVFEIFATTTLSADTTIRLVISALAGLAASAGFAALAARAAHLGPAIGDVTVMSATYGNVGNAGLAICAFALGDDALGQAGVLMVTIMFCGTFLAVWLGTRRSQSSLRAARDALVSPMILAAIVGFAVNLVGFDPPTVIDRVVSTIAGALIPTMLLALGIQLVESGRLGWFRSTSVVGVVKLIVAPAAAFAVATLVGLDGDDRGVVLLQSAMPPAVFCMVLAIEHDLAADRATNDVVTTTLAALLTLPIALMIAA